MKDKVFLGGTCNGSTWRDEFIEKLTVDYFNPVVEEWNEEAYKIELDERENDRFLLYTLTPKMTGFYSVAEAVNDSNKRPERTIINILYDDNGQTFTEHQKKSMIALEKMLMENGAKVFSDSESCINYINTAL